VHKDRESEITVYYWWIMLWPRYLKRLYEAFNWCVIGKQWPSSSHNEIQYRLFAEAEYRIMNILTNLPRYACSRGQISVAFVVFIVFVVCSSRDAVETFQRRLTLYPITRQPLLLSSSSMFGNCQPSNTALLVTTRITFRSRGAKGGPAWMKMWKILIHVE